MSGLKPQACRAEWLGNDNRKTMIKVKNYRLNAAFQKRHGFAQSISSAWLCDIQGFNN